MGPGSNPEPSPKSIEVSARIDGSNKTAVTVCARWRKAYETALLDTAELGILEELTAVISYTERVNPAL